MLVGDAEGGAFAPQRNVTASNGERPSSGSVIANLFGQWAVRASVVMAAGVDNLFDRRYAPHLAVCNRVMGPDVPIGARQQAPGRSVFLRMDIKT